jgi:hypothetical protein
VNECSLIIYPLEEILIQIKMTKIKLAHNIRKEIKKLNHEIDLKIIKGLPYKAEARRHKFLVSQFYGFYESSKRSWFQRTMHVFASFVL